MPKSSLVAVHCGSCGETVRTRGAPDACFRCGAMFCRGARYVRVELAVELRGGIAMRFRPVFVGAWSAAERTEIEGQLAVD